MPWKETFTMLMRTDPFRELDRLTHHLLGVHGHHLAPGGDVHGRLPPRRAVRRALRRKIEITGDGARKVINA
jgi:hypothetical protein